MFPSALLSSRYPPIPSDRRISTYALSFTGRPRTRTFTSSRAPSGRTESCRAASGRPGVMGRATLRAPAAVSGSANPPEKAPHTVVPVGACVSFEPRMPGIKMIGFRSTPWYCAARSYSREKSGALRLEAQAPTRSTIRPTAAALQSGTATGGLLERNERRGIMSTGFGRGRSMRCCMQPGSHSSRGRGHRYGVALVPLPLPPRIRVSERPSRAVTPSGPRAGFSGPPGPRRRARQRSLRPPRLGRRPR